MKTKYMSRIEAVRLPVSRLVALFMVILLFIAKPQDLPEPVENLLLAIGLALAGLGAFGRLWCSVYIAGRKTRELVTEGPYSLCRNPLYLFSLIGALGVALTTHSLTIFLLVAVFFLLYYPGVIHSEEAKMRLLHGVSFERYCAATPAFLPRHLSLQGETFRLVDVRLFRTHMSEAIWFIFVIALLALLNILHESGILPTLLTIY